MIIKGALQLMLFLIFLSLLGCSNTLPQNQVNVSTESMENICQKNGFSYEYDMDNRNVDCVFPDGSSCNALDYYTGECHQKKKDQLRDIDLSYIGDPATISSLTVTIEYDINEAIPLFKDAKDNFYLSPNIQIATKHRLNSPNLVGASATRKSILFAAIKKEGMNINGLIATLPMTTTAEFSEDYFNITSVSIIDMDGTKISNLNDFSVTLS